MSRAHAARVVPYVNEHVNIRVHLVQRWQAALTAARRSNKSHPPRNAVHVTPRAHASTFAS
uniref:Uncharacterized protein n=1 Tax=viral metagenome TaxID=1070528 RepID=A0A6C0AUV2_9ZZZZ